MYKKLLAIFLLFSLFVSGFSAIKIQRVISDMKDFKNLIDGNTGTSATGKPGDNTIILQLGNIKYIQELKLVMSASPGFKKISVFTSDNYIQWSNISVRENVSEPNPVYTFTNLNALFIKIIIQSDAEFKINEIECLDQQAPKNRIFNIKTESIGENSAVISWETDIKTEDYFTYYAKVKGTKATLFEIDYKTSHSVQLKGLLKGTDYQYSIISQSPDGTKIESSLLDFRTKGIALPDIWELKAVNITPYTAKLAYRSNVPTTYEVYLGFTESKMDLFSSGRRLTDNNEFSFSNLKPETGYYYKLILKDSSGNVALTPPLYFITPADNIALGKKAIGTFNFVDEDIKKRGFGETTVEKTVDGNLNYFGGMALSYNADRADQYVIIDLNQTEPVKRIDVYWWALSFSKDYRIDFSTNGMDWTTVKDHLDAEKGIDTSSPGGDYLVLQAIPISKSARFVKIFIKAGNTRGTRVKKWKPRENLYINEIAIIKDVQ